MSPDPKKSFSRTRPEARLRGRDRPRRQAYVLGGGVSGMAAARLLMSRGNRVTILEQNDLRRRSLRGELRAPEGAAEVLGDVPAGTNVSLAVASPGFSPSHPWVERLMKSGVEVVGECEWAARFWKGGLLAITGTKGKSSVTKLCAEALRRSGRGAEACGNFGKPLSALVLETPSPEWAVLEISSFQLEMVETLRPDIGVLLNVLPDHLDRHGSLRAYRAVKFRLFRRQTPKDTALLPQGLRRPPGTEIKARLQRFGSGQTADWRYTPGRISRKSGPSSWTLDLAGSWFDNPVLGPHAAAAAGALASCGLAPATVRQALKDFQPLPHRNQLVGIVAGVRYVNDSKATSLDAMVASAEMTGGAILLIVGGRLKKDNPARVKEKLASRVRKVYCIGESASVFYKSWKADMECRETGTLARALEHARREARGGETVLLAPGCASFDQFDNYEQRGECFTRLVRAFCSQK